MKASDGAGTRRVLVAWLGAASLATLVGAAVVPSACVNIPPQKPDACNVQIVTLRIFADEYINPNEDEKTRPVMVRLYQLKSDMKILNARYDDLLLKEKETLGDQLVKVDEFEIFPNSVYEVKFERIPDASILAGAAFFRSPIGQSWKTYYEFPPMPNTPEACGAAGGGGKDPAAKEKKPQAFPSTEFFIRDRKIDNGSEFDPSMFPSATNFKKINLPRASATKESQQSPSPAPAPASK